MENEIILVPGENFGLTNAQYHSEKLHLSSSNLKTLLQNPTQFYEEKVLGNRPPEVEKPHLVLGSFVHSLILEPDQVAKEYAFFEGWRKYGKAFDEFKVDNPGKVIISVPQKDVGEKLARSTEANPHVSRLLTGGVAELSLASKLLGVPVKMRADYINKASGYIVDVKTTSQPTSRDAFKETITQYRYDLSAALYCQIAHDVFGKLFDFYFVVISKSDLGCAVYKASSNTLSTGAADVTKALVLYKKYAESNWDLTTKESADNIDNEILEV